MNEADLYVLSVTAGVIESRWETWFSQWMVLQQLDYDTQMLLTFSQCSHTLLLVWRSNMASLNHVCICPHTERCRLVCWKRFYVTKRYDCVYTVRTYHVFICLVYISNKLCRVSAFHFSNVSSVRMDHEYIWWHRGAVGRVSDLWSRGRGFDCQLGTRRKNWGRFQRHLCASVTKQYKLIPA